MGFLSLADLYCLDVCLGAGQDTRHLTWFRCLPREETRGFFSVVAATAVRAAATAVPKYDAPEGQPRLGCCSGGAG